jgi:microcystin degradation protein MlrC
MRIAVGGFMHETNTFVPIPTTWDDFVRAGPWPTVTEGEAVLSLFRGINLAIAHFMDAAETAGHVMVPLAWGAAMPAGRVTDDAFERMAAKMVAGLERGKPDAVFLELHGAMATESHDDGEGELLRRIRAAVGPPVPILASLDLHANVSPAMVELADFFSSYRTYPHVDWGASGARCAEWLDRVLAWKRPARALRQLPFLVPVTAGCTYVEPAGGLYEELERIEATTGVHLSLNMGFPPADIADVGPSIVAYGPDQESVDGAADRLLAAVLAAEGAFAAHRPLPVADAVAEAMRIAQTASRPVVLADTQDNPGAGAPSNTTGLIAELLRQGAERAAVGIVHDPDAAAAAHGRGIGATLDRLGGGLADGPGQQPLPGPWRVAALSDGRFKGTSPMLRSAVTEMGPTALLAQNGVEVLVATIRQQPVHREVFTHLGMDVNSRAILGLKSSAHFRSGYQEIAERVIVCLAPGINVEDPASFRFGKIRPGVRLRPRAA